MVDVIVDAKALAHLPADPTTVPDAVKKRADAINAFYNKDGQRPHDVTTDPGVPVIITASEPTPEPSPISTETPSQVQKAPEPPPTQARETRPTSPPASAAQSPRTADPPADTDANSGTWRDRYHGLQGRYTASQKTIGELQEQMTMLGNELLQLQRRVPAQQEQHPPQPPPSYLTDYDVANYGTELIDLTQRAAAQVMEPRLAQIQEDNARLREQLAREARRGLDQQVEIAIPNYREIDRDPRWHRWLLSIDLLSGRVRQTLLNEAISSANAPRVISFFRGFLNEEAATGHLEPAPSPKAAPVAREPAVNLASLAAPGRARPANGGDPPMLPSDKPIYTRAIISQLYDQQRRGQFIGREAEWARQEADIFAAQREGRVR